MTEKYHLAVYEADVWNLEEFRFNGSYILILQRNKFKSQGLNI
jgi:hypothetical protein